VTFNVRVDLVRRSLPQLKWLLEMTSSSTITVVSPTTDSDPSVTSLPDLVYVTSVEYTALSGLDRL